MDLTFYELSYTRAPADRDALSFMIKGAQTRFAADEPEGSKESETPVTPSATPQPTDQQLLQWVDRAVHDAFMTRYKKLVKDEVYRQLEDKIKRQQIEIRPVVKEMVEDKKEEIAPETAQTGR
jgi:hypothetical protein